MLPQQVSIMVHVVEAVSEEILSDSDPDLGRVVRNLNVGVDA